ncbi:MAG TPA: undecaprenyl-phosphate glucose phosphotransferase [Bacteroidota bacterium]|nr:undecaprenyl-phosphate glucose phosphotransferase [Bacteroidota bacterium]
MARLRRNDLLIPTLGVLFDALAIECSFLLSYWLRFSTPYLKFLTENADTPPLHAYVYGSLFVIPVWLVMFRSRGMYGARRNVTLSQDLFSIIKLVTFGMLVVMSAAFFYRAFSYSRLVFGLLWISSIIFIFCGRVLLSKIEKALYRSGRELCNAAIIGSNEIAQRIFESFHDHPLQGYRLLGYFADSEAAARSPLAGATFLGTLTQIPAKIESDHLNLALIALHQSEHAKLYRLMRECEGIDVEFLMVPDFLELLASRMSVKEIAGTTFIKVKGMPITTWGRISKRASDVALSTLLLALFSPLLLLVAILVKLNSRGPVLFRQERIGIDGKPFQMLKFRSMDHMAERETGPVWAKENDPRNTSIGAFLRRTSLDEFPQLINVLRGEMSLVGPRPERPYFVEQFSGKDDPLGDSIPKYLDRHRMKTGMTGWAQINGLRGNTSLEERIAYDLYYIENWSLGFDFRILVRTVGALFSNSSPVDPPA